MRCVGFVGERRLKQDRIYAKNEVWIDAISSVASHFGSEIIESIQVVENDV